MAAVAPALMIASTVASTATAAASGVMAARNASAQADAARMNAEFARELGERNALAAREDAKAEEDRYRDEMRQRIAYMQSRYGARGVALTGTPLEILGKATAEAERNALLIRHAGSVQAQQALLGAQIQSRNDIIAASGYQSQIGQSLLGGFGQAAGSALSGVGGMYSMGWRPGSGNNQGMYAQ